MTLVVAHRGASRRAPENTMAAFALAVEDGADAIECDVHLTGDGQLAVVHDATLERTTDRTMVVASTPMADIRSADAGWAFAGPDQGFPFRGTGLTVPTLPEVLAWLPAGMGLAVEIKVADAADAVVAALTATTVREGGLVSVVSFHERALDRVRELDVGIPTGLLLVPGDSFERGLTWVVEHGHTAVLPYEADLGADPEPPIQQARYLDRRVGCYVVNDAERMRQLAAVGIWGFVTDLPDLARATLGPAAGGAGTLRP